MLTFVTFLSQIHKPNNGIVGSRRIQINIEDADGVKMNIKLEGDVSRDKLMKVYDMLELMENKEVEQTPDTLGAKIWSIIEKYFTPGPFTSTGVLEKYEDEYNEPIKLSVISTYLARFSSRAKLSRNKKGREWAYTRPPILTQS